MPPRSRRAKSQSISSNISEPVLVNGAMPPPSPPTSTRASPNVTRHRKTPSTTTPTTLSHAAPRPGVTIPSMPSRRPGVLQFLLVAGMSSVLEAALQSVASQFGAGDLATVSKHSESWVEVGGLLAWKVVTLGVYWFGGFDAYDVASLTLLLRTPTLLLLSMFYLIQPSTLITTTLSTVIASTVPFLVFRPLLPQHDPKSHPHAPRTLLRNKSILTDPFTTIFTSLLSTAIFAVILELSFQTFLPVWLATYFTPGLRSLVFAHLGPAGLPVLLLVLIPAGYASRTFLFTPSTGATDLTADNSHNHAVFDPATAGFFEHINWNLWGWYSARQKELISRTVVLAVLIMVETVVETWGEVKGVELTGALGYAGVWAVGVFITGAVLEWVGGPSD